MPDDRYLLISADTHAGGSHAAYREYLDPAYLADFDAWRSRYKNPYKDLAPGDDRRFRDWDNEMRNNAQDADGVRSNRRRRSSGRWCRRWKSRWSRCPRTRTTRCCKG